MVRGRIETTPSEQLVALRKARDHYVALADRFKDSSDSVTTKLDDRQRERDARRIASAYDKSITNMAAKMVRAGTPSRTASFFNNLGMARPIFAIAIALVALVALVYPGVFEGLRASVKVAPPVLVAPASPATQPHVTADELAPTPAMDKGPMMPKRPPAAAGHGPATLRPTAVAEQVHPLARPTKSAQPKISEDDDVGFVTKVLQPDGSLKEVHFPTMPRH
jgi:hypothetical protein